MRWWLIHLFLLPCSPGSFPAASQTSFSPPPQPLPAFQHEAFFLPPILLSCFAAHTRIQLKNQFQNWSLSPPSFLPFSLSLPLPSCFAARVKKFIIQTCGFVFSSVGLFCYGRRRDRLGTLNRAHPTYYIQNRHFQPQMLLKLLGEWEGRCLLRLLEGSTVCSACEKVVSPSLLCTVSIWLFKSLL